MLDYRKIKKKLDVFQYSQNGYSFMITSEKVEEQMKKSTEEILMLVENNYKFLSALIEKDSKDQERGIMFGEDSGKEEIIKKIKLLNA